MSDEQISWPVFIRFPVNIDFGEPQARSNPQGSLKQMPFPYLCICMYNMKTNPHKEYTTEGIERPSPLPWLLKYKKKKTSNFSNIRRWTQSDEWAGPLLFSSKPQFSLPGALPRLSLK